MNVETTKRFWSKVEKTSTCWIWTASKRCKGYGAFVWADPNGKIIQGRAHRFSWELEKGQIPPGICCLHKCDVPACVNPDHLFLGSKADNNRDMCDKGRHVSGGTHCGSKGKYERGEKHHAAKINERTVRLIRKLKPRFSCSQLARRFGLGIGHISQIANRKAWKHVE